jgi:predicted negative regulator of RcsB-dependent stress response
VASNLSRKALKQDTFAVEVEHTVDFFAAHRPQVIRYGGIAAAIILIAGIVWFFRSSQQSARQQVLGQAMTLFAAPVGPSQGSGVSFPSEAAKNAAVVKAFTQITSDYGGSEEAYIAEYYLAGSDAENGKLDDARKKYQDVVDHANANYSSLAKLALAQTDVAQNRSADAAKLLKDLMDHPTELVSKDEATIEYARTIAPTQPDEARKLLTPLTSPTSDVKGVASAALDEIPKK